jgi:uncharacterized integral membrane protein
VLQRLLLLPLLAPLLAVLLVAALNPTPSSRLRLLIWTSPALPIGAWMALAASGGAALSAGLTALALQPAERRLRRQTRQAAPAYADREPWDTMAEASARGRHPGGRQGQDSAPGTVPTAGPERGAQDPPPTLSVPYRILRTGSGHGVTPEPVPAAGVSRATPAGGGTAAATAASGDDGWDTPPSDDW